MVRSRLFLFLLPLLVCAQQAPPIEKPSSNDVPVTTSFSGSSSKTKTRKVDGNGLSELMAHDFALGASTCALFESQIEYSGSTTVALSVLALQQNLGDTVLIPFFGTPVARYMTAGTPLYARDFTFSDSGGAPVPVLGPLLKVRVCNNNNRTVTYTHLIAYAAAR